MATKQKVNPNRIPVSKKDFNIGEITRQVTIEQTMRSWAIMLGALADLPETTNEMIKNLWTNVNAYSSGIHQHEDAKKQLRDLERITGLKLPFEKLSSKNIKTKGDLDKFVRKISQNATFAAFALITEPIIKEELLPEDQICELVKKAYKLDEELKEGRISLDDICAMLEDEYDIVLSNSENTETCSLK